MCLVNPGFNLVGASLLCHLTLKVVVKGICLPMNSYHQLFIITGIPIRKKNPEQMSANPVFKFISVVAVSRPSLPVNHLL